MIKAIPDTNIILRGMFGYQSPHRKLLSLAVVKRIQLLGCNESYLEFCEKAYKPEIQRYWKTKNFSPEKVILDYKSAIMMHEPVSSLSEIKIPIADPDDAIFFKLALSSGINLIISEDVKHVHKLNGYQGIKVITAEQFMKAFAKSTS